ncbi:MAG TPA: ATP-binding protein [Azospirillaceae bacterium]|nr:ATP-binding protein [Azospirillaceae bacterium]
MPDTAEKSRRSGNSFHFAVWVAAAPVVAVLLMGLILYLGNAGLTTVVGQIRQIVTHNLDGSVKVAEIAQRVQTINATLYRLTTLQAAGIKDADIAGGLVQLGGEVDRVIGELGIYRDNFANERQAEAINQAVDQLREYKVAVDWVSWMLEIDFASSVAFIRPFNEIFDRVTGVLADMTQSAVTDARGRSDQATNDAQQTIQWFLIIMVGAVIVVSGGAWLTGVYQQKLVFNTRLLEDQVAERTRELAQRTHDLEESLEQLHQTQQQLVVKEKMASLGELTAGIAHEIKNPLNFVNNFSELSVELLEELKEAVAPAAEALDDNGRADIEDIVEMLTGNLQKIRDHGKRADGIVKGMLLHSRGSTGERVSSEINALIEEALNLAYHGMRAQKPDFNVNMLRNLDPATGNAEVAPQEVTRVLLNLFANGFYAIHQRKQDNAEASFEPALSVTSRSVRDSWGRDAVEIRVRDNGTGIPQSAREKIFNPFFTTKPPGEGTGLGLSLSYDVVVQQHSGQFTVESEEGRYTEFTVVLPRKAIHQTQPSSQQSVEALA